MKIFSSKEVQEIDNYTIENEPIASIDLMERAAAALTNWFVRKFRVNRKIKIFAGPGNNGGDALAIARMLIEKQYTVDCYLVSSSGKLSKDCSLNLQRLKEQGKVSISNIKSTKDIPAFTENDIIVDGIFGSGLSRPVEGMYLDLIRALNSGGSTILSIDIPSGLFGEDNQANNMDAIVKATHTLTFQFPFLSFLFADSHRFVGDWKVLDIGLHPEAIRKTPSSYSLSDRELIRQKMPIRSVFAHKGTMGHALIIAGSFGMMGAAILTGEACLRSGSGLVSLHVPKDERLVVQTAFPEAILSLDPNEHMFSRVPDTGKYSAVAVGPGLGTNKASADGLKKLLEQKSIPLLLDADALNLLAENRNLLEGLPENTILTPHPLEFDRLAGKSENGYERLLRQIEFAQYHKCIIVLKGAFSSVVSPDGLCYFNPTGNPGMATGGSGDVLSGIIVSLLAQGADAYDAALAGTYLHGLAGDLAAEDIGQEALIAGDITRYLGPAFKRIRSQPFLPDERI